MPNTANTAAMSHKELTAHVAALPKPIRYDIVDNQTKAVVGACKTSRAAYNSVDKRDNAYGACRYSAVAVWEA